MKITVRKHDIIVEDDDGWLTEADKAALVKHLESRRGAIEQQMFEALIGMPQIESGK